MRIIVWRVQELEKEQVQRATAAKALPDFGPGDNLQLKLVRNALLGKRPKVVTQVEESTFCVLSLHACS